MDGISLARNKFLVVLKGANLLGIGPMHAWLSLTHNDCVVEKVLIFNAN